MNPRLLLLEDDPVSAAFLLQALGGATVEVDHVATVAGARALAGERHVLWLFDARLPDGHGADLLAELRGRGMQAPALALTAQDDPRELARLRDAGFTEVLTKPIAAACLVATVRRHFAGGEGARRWDEEAALSALGGDFRSVQAMRQLFLAELADQGGRLLHAIRSGDHASAREQLHRLKASCGFVGARELLDQVNALSRDPGDGPALARFQARVHELLLDAAPVIPA